MRYNAFGKGMDRMPDHAFRFMAVLFVFWDFIREMTSLFTRRLASFGIQEGFTVINYGCGPGGYLRAASRLVGDKGRVYAVDIHPLAIKSVEKKIARYNLSNVAPVLADGYSCNLEDRVADVIYALDMFHMVKIPSDFLRECHRLLKRDGHLIIDDGHQRRRDTKQKMVASKLWRIIEDTGDHLTCIPV